MTAPAWTFSNSTHIRFGKGARQHLRDYTAGKRVLAVSTRRGRAQFEADAALGPSLAQASIAWMDEVEPNPDLAHLQQRIDRFKQDEFDLVVAFGGGSAIDAGKALAAALGHNRGATLAQLIADPALQTKAGVLPLVALPTTSGTGAEVTPFATIWDMAARKKLSLAGPSVQPLAAIVDPELTYGLPAEATLASSLDALNQALESSWNVKASPLTLSLAGRAISLALDAVPRLAVDGSDTAARDAMAEASLLAGICISQTRTAICHSVSYPITAHFGVSHGLACAFTMTAAAELCLNQAASRFDAIAGWAGLESGQRLYDRIADLTAELGVGARVRSQVPGLEPLLALNAEMYTPGRADNFVVPIDSALIDRLLRTSYGRP